MSKKIWRGDNDIFNGEPLAVWPSKRPNCTVVPDSACFPVREAMALCATICFDIERGSFYVDPRKWSKYLAAVERMKRRAGK